jgi:hypothetical protein
LAVVAIGFLSAGAAGCSQFNSALGKQWVTVSFRPGTPVHTMLQVRSACAHVTGVTPGPLPSHPTQASMVDSITFNTTSASDSNVVQLQQCVQRFPSVQGFTLGDSGDEGG